MYSYSEGLHLCFMLHKLTDLPSKYQWYNEVRNINRLYLPGLSILPSHIPSRQELFLSTLFQLSQNPSCVPYRRPDASPNNTTVSRLFPLVPQPLSRVECVATFTSKPSGSFNTCPVRRPSLVLVCQLCYRSTSHTFRVDIWAGSCRCTHHCLPAWSPTTFDPCWPEAPFARPFPCDQTTPFLQISRSLYVLWS